MLDGAGPGVRPAWGRTTEKNLLVGVRRPRGVVHRQVDSLRPLRVVADTANGMGGLVVPCRVRDDCRDSISRSCTASSTARSRTTPPIRSSRPTSATSRRGSCRAASTSDWPSTVTPTASSWSTRLAAASAGSTTTALLAAAVLRKNPGATVLYNLICSPCRARGDPRERRRAGAHQGRPLEHQAGMAETGAVFGGEHSAHYYFRDNYRADSGLIASMLVLERAQPQRTSRCPCCASRSSATASSGEINTQVDDTDGRDRARWQRPTSRRHPGQARRAHGRLWSRGGSTCAPRTPSRCCASTSRHPTATPATPMSPSCWPSAEHVLDA